VETEHQSDLASDPDYQAGYAAMMRLRNYARRSGWPTPPERILVTELLWLERSARIAAHHDEHTLEMFDQAVKPAAWYRGRAAALRLILREAREGQGS
jgi:hypothetical protein